MCGRYTLTTTIEELWEELELLDEPPELTPRYNIAPTQDVPVIGLRPGAAHARLAMLRWGLIPAWAKDEKAGARTINARRETLADKPSFRDSFRTRRCLVVADGWYEWKKRGDRKQPYYLGRADRRPFTMAGLWASWRGPDGVRIRSCTVITQPSAGIVETIHTRMPVLIPAELRRAWMDPELRARQQLAGLLEATPLDELDAYPVSTTVNAAHNDTARCVERVDP